MTELICIVCPKGCHIKVDEQNDCAVTGNGCKRGEAYGKKELTNPTRVVPSTVKINGGAHRRLPVKTSEPIPKAMIFDAMKLLDAVEVTSPVKRGEVVYKNILGTGIDFIATRDM